MTVGLAAVLFSLCTAGAVISFRTAGRRGSAGGCRRLPLITGITCCAGAAACALYIGAALLLLGGI